MEALDYYTEAEEREKEDILNDGLALFEKIFGYRSKSFIASCYIWSNSAEKILHKNGVQYIQGILNQIEPTLINNEHTYRYKKHFLGMKNASGQYYLLRNAFYEPSQFPGLDSVDECLKRISIAFMWHKPAIIGSHRLNFIGYIDPTNRMKNLASFKLLLNTIIKKWPNVEFMASDQLGDIIMKNQLKNPSH
jgi:hypothetical protein